MSNCQLTAPAVAKFAPTTLLTPSYQVSKTMLIRNACLASIVSARTGAVRAYFLLWKRQATIEVSLQLLERVIQKASADTILLSYDIKSKPHQILFSAGLPCLGDTTSFEGQW